MNNAENRVEVHPFQVGPMDNRTYVLSVASGSCLLVDPSFEVERVIEFIEDKGLTVDKIVDTHGHFDHIVGNAPAKRAFPDAPLLFPEGDRQFLEKLTESAQRYGFEVEESPEPDRDLSELDTLDLDGAEIGVRHTPGHSPGHHCLTRREDGFIIVADLIFRGSIGRTDLPGGDMQTLVKSARDLMEDFPDDTKLFPGHGDPTTIGRERETNPHVGDAAVGA